MRGNQICKVSKSAKRMFKTNKVVIGKQCIINGDDMFEESSKNKIAQKSCHEKLLNLKSLKGGRIVSVRQIKSVLYTAWRDKNMIIEWTSKTKNGKFAGPLGLVT